MWILIIAFYAGTFSSGDSVSLTVAEFTSEDHCNQAGKAAISKFDMLMKGVKYMCVAK